MDIREVCLFFFSKKKKGEQKKWQYRLIHFNIFINIGARCSFSCGSIWMLLSSLIFRIISWAWKKSSFPTASSTRLRHSISLGLSSKMSQPTPTGCRKRENNDEALGNPLFAKTTGTKNVPAGTGRGKTREELMEEHEQGGKSPQVWWTYLGDTDASLYFKGHLSQLLSAGTALTE